MSWDEVHDEAEALQQVVSDLLIDRIDAALGHPRRDPHGDPSRPSGSVRLVTGDDVPLFRAKSASSRRPSGPVW